VPPQWRAAGRRGELRRRARLAGRARLPLVEHGLALNQEALPQLHILLREGACRVR